MSGPSYSSSLTSHGATSVMTGSTGQGTPPQSQTEMKEYCKAEIQNDTWEFSPSNISFMLSPKTLRSGVKPEDIKSFQQARDNCEFLIEKPFFAAALSHAVKLNRDHTLSWPKAKKKKNPPEESYYRPLVAFLNTCIKNCNTALDEVEPKYENVPHLTKRIYGDLQFQKYGKQMKDSVDGAFRLKPDIGGAKGLEAGKKLRWGGTGGDAVIMGIPVEVESSWPGLLAQAAAYGRCLFSASPTRSWSLVLGFNCQQQTLRFLIFHRGGCTASVDINVLTQEGQLEAHQLFLTILLWTENYHVGFSSFSTDDEFAIPDPLKHELTLRARVEKYVHHMIAIRTRGTLVGVVSPQDFNTSRPLNTSDPPHPTSNPPNLEPAISSRRSQSKPRTKRKADGDRKDDSKRPRSDQPRPISNFAGRNEAKNSGSSTGETESKSPPIVPHNSGRSIAVGIKAHRFQTGLSLEQLKERLSNKNLLLKFCWPDAIQGSIEAEFLSTTSGKFGTPSHVASYQIIEPSGLLVSNRIFLPSSGEANSTRWAILAKKGHEAQPPNYRDATCHLFAAIGETLLHAHSSWELCESVAHAMLGWLSYYQQGYIHRDVSIGNLLRLPDALSMAEVEVQDPFMVHEMDTNGLDVSTVKEETLGYVTKIKDLVESLKIGKECKGILIDGDMAAQWKTYFDKDHGHRTLSGTQEFMSQDLLIAQDGGDSYLQSPVDDIHSFFWTTLWAVLFNRDNDRSIGTEKQYRDWWMTTVRTRTNIVSSMVKAKRNKKLVISPIAAQMCDFLSSWSARIEALANDWNETYSGSPEINPECYTISHFHLYAYRGVYEALKLVKESQEALMEYGFFETST